MADPKTLRNLQRYIYKRPQDQTPDEVFAHIEKVQAKEGLTQEDWDLLLGCACSHPDAEVLRGLIERGARPQPQLAELMTATVGSREHRMAWAERRIAVLEVLAEHAAPGETGHLTPALSNACWFNDIGSAVWLIEHGADIHFKAWNAFYEDDVDCLANAAMYGERTGDYALRDFLQPWYDARTPLGDWRALYAG